MCEKFSVNKTTLDSLIYFCFGFTLDDSFEIILENIMEKAYKDATNQGAFNTKADSKEAQIAKYEDNGSISILKNQICVLLESSEIIDFDNWHRETCMAIKKKYYDKGLGQVFSYGNAQKWVNMSLKYLYLLCGITEEYAESFYYKANRILKYKNKLHVPIDSYIIDVLWNYKDIELPKKEGITAKREKEYKTPSEYVKGWSNWSDTEYDNAVEGIQKQLDIENTTPIEWETEKWIKRSKERKGLM